jgi:rhodanese-related sulfurtransferase
MMVALVHLATRIVDVKAVKELRDRGAQLVEVLPLEEYEELHLPGAVHLPLKELGAEHARLLDQERPVIVYCWDALCDMSPRAATRLEQLGYDVYDYARSKVDWMAHGLPMEGTAAERPTAGSFVREDAATCTREDRSDAIRQRIDASPYGFALVLAGRVVLGRVRRSRLEEDRGDPTAELLMEPGPSTARPHTDPSALASSLQGSGASTAILTTPEGELIGVVRAADLVDV